jgi:hypothetical protein
MIEALLDGRYAALHGGMRSGALGDRLRRDGGQR